MGAHWVLKATKFITFFYENTVAITSVSQYENV